MVNEKTHPVEADILERYTRRTAGSRMQDVRAKKRLPGGDTRTATYFAPYPAYMDYGKGCYLYDIDGNTYLDLLNNYTSLIHGHAHPAVVAATREQLDKGTVFGAAGEIQYRHAEHICTRLPAMDQVRYCNSGTEATLFAIRAARAFTGKDAVIKIDGGYHGSHDLAEVNIFPDPYPEGRPTPRITAGVPASVLKDVFVVPFNDLEGMEAMLKNHVDKVAAVLVEPLMGAAGAIPSQPGYLEGLRMLADKYGVLLIFDEVMTFRLGWGGLQAAEDIRPDLTAFGKIIGGGLPIGAFGGRKDIMSQFDPAGRGTIFHSGTFNGCNITMAAGLAAMEAYDRNAVERLNQLGAKLRDGIADALETSGITGCLTGFGSMLNLHWTDEKPVTAFEALSGSRNAPGLFGLAHIEMMNRGVYTARRGMFVLSTPMIDEDIAKAIGAFKETLNALKPYIADRIPHLLNA